MAEPTSGGPVGRSVPRVDGVAKVTGAARYLDDLDLHGAWHGATVRSTVAHATFHGIELDPGFDWTDVVVVTSADITGPNVVMLIEDDQPALAPIGGRIQHVDEAIALVAAPTRARALEARKHVTAKVTPLPAVFTIEDSQHVFKTFVIRKGHQDDAAFEAAMRGAVGVVQSQYRTSPQEQMYIEPQAMAAHWDGATCHVVGSMQCPYYIHKGIKGLLGIGGEDLVITQAVTGGGFGGKEEYPSMIAAHCALLARKAGRAVKIVYDRDEDIAATTKRHPAVIWHRLALDADGSIVAIDVDVAMDGGAYLTLSPVVLSRGVLHAAGPYKCPVVRITGRVVQTNHPPHGAFRGFGAPQTTFPYERQIDKAARLRGEDPLMYRMKHALRLGDTTATGQVLDASVGTDEVLTAVARAAGPRKPRVGTAPSGAPLRRGRGFCFYFHGAGFTGSGEQRLAGRATVAFGRAGGFEVRSSSTDIGQGATTIFAQFAASALGVTPDEVRVADPSTERVPDSGPTVASRTCMIVGGLVERAARILRDRIGAWGEAHGQSGRPIAEVAAAMADAEGGELVETVQYAPPPGIIWDDATYTGSAYPCYGWGACMVDLAVDLDTCEVTVERCVQAIDVGKAINPVIVKGQIEGGTLQALGWALLENVVYKDGKVANANMTNCIVPTFADAPDLETIIVEVPYPHGPHGAKGVGEIPMDGPAAAVANALRDALGVDFDELPILPETIAARRSEWERNL